jgi:hypothetical protein
MPSKLDKLVLERLGASQVISTKEIQSLWSGYGQIVRYQLRGGDVSSVVVKHVKLPDNSQHPKGWNTNLSHQRKIKSYQVESNWYKNWSTKCDLSCRVPKCFLVESSDSEFFMLLEDLDASGYSLRIENASLNDMSLCLDWLANFHANFLAVNCKTDTQQLLWPKGTYWHLDTRPDELEALGDVALKAAAVKIDQLLTDCRFKTLVHGDAKLANFCFSSDQSRVAAVDFQYVGGGCGMKDVAYFIGSCLHEDDCERYEAELLNGYFFALQKALENRKRFINFRELENEWRIMFSIAWTDFHRFLKGWSPGHWKIHGYSERLAQQVINRYIKKD